MEKFTVETNPRITKGATKSMYSFEAETRMEAVKIVAEKECVEPNYSAIQDAKFPSGSFVVEVGTVIICNLP